MRPAAQIVLVEAARLHGPLLALFAFSLLALRAPGDGVGFVAGLAFALTLALHALVFGAAAARAAFPPTAMRLLLAAGVVIAMAGAALPGFRFAPLLVEGGLFAVTSAAANLIVAVVFGRAPTLRDAEW